MKNIWTEGLTFLDAIRLYPDTIKIRLVILTAKKKHKTPLIGYGVIQSYTSGETMMIAKKLYSKELIKQAKTFINN